MAKEKNFPTAKRPPLFLFNCIIKGFDYSRSGNPTRVNFETAVASLEKGKHGVAFSSGSSVTATVLSMVGAGSHVLSVNDVYGGTYRYFTKVAPVNGSETSFVDLKEAASIKEALKPNTKVKRIIKGLIICDLQKHEVMT